MNFSEIETKWQKKWEESKVFSASNNSEKEKYYILVEFPYPSGSGLHVGHVRSYTALDSVARKRRMQGYNVLFPMGWDAFGSPAEQYAIKHHIHPRDAVKENVKVFKDQIQKLGISFDWDREFSTADENYYKWTQWQFLKFYEHGLAYKARKSINWCPECKVGLSNEDSSGGVCERCGTKVVQKEKEQWMLKIRDYAEDLLEGLDHNDFQEHIKTAQRNWIGKSVGAQINFKVEDTEDNLSVFTTRPDTIYGVTFMVVAPEHPIIEKYKNKISNYEDVLKYKEFANTKSEFERSELNKEKTGVRLEGLNAINPLNKEKIQIWVSDYVLMNYGTGAIMAVPAHDQRDFDFAKKFNIPIVPVIEKITGVPNENESFKKSIVALVYNPNTDKYLTLNWNNKGGRLLIGGTIKENENPVDCAIREIKEETGYSDLKFISTSFPKNHHGMIE
jgi:leucyl-tRNA synthetase